jgi:hypothetical protein
MKISILNRILLLITCLLAAYQVAVGINGLENVPTIAYTIAFGVLLVAGLLIIILGYDILNSPVVVVVSTVIPLSLSLGLIWEHIGSLRYPYLIFAILGFLAIIVTRTFRMPGGFPTLVLALVHGVAGMIVFLLPSILAAQGITNPGFALVGLGGALIGLGGLLLSFLKTGRPIVSSNIILRILPGILLLMTIAFVTGFALA